MTHIVALLLAALGLLVFASVASRYVKAWLAKTRLPGNIVTIVSNAIWITCLAFATLYALDALGLQNAADISGILLLSLSVLFKDVLENFIDGGVILAERSFNIGDTIEVGTDQGEVISIGLRLTRLENDTGIIIIPNSQLYTEIIRICKNEKSSEFRLDSRPTRPS